MTNCGESPERLLEGREVGDAPEAVFEEVRALPEDFDFELEVALPDFEDFEDFESAIPLFLSLTGNAEQKLPNRRGSALFDIDYTPTRTNVL